MEFSMCVCVCVCNQKFKKNKKPLCILKRFHERSLACILEKPIQRQNILGSYLPEYQIMPVCNCDNAR